jgi:alkanesulfonate monooxygenase SsuD/methylene tetrahydromethanopterin reductase-like flavin-dependent oxidoreductase (luciferase family)
VSAARHGIFVAPFDELSDPTVVAELAVRAEQAGWDGFFVWDHVEYRSGQAVADPWVTLTAVALATERVTIGPLVTPVARRRPHQLARETVTLDRLSGGRLVLGAGLGGSLNTPEFDPARFGEEGDPKARAVLLDEGLERLAAYWDGDFEPRPLQQPRIPVWIASRWPSRRPLRRAARWDGMFPIEMPGPAELAELVAEVQAMRNVFLPFEVVVTGPAGRESAPWIEAGATWCLAEFGPQPTRAEVEQAIDAGPA